MKRFRLLGIIMLMLLTAAVIQNPFTSAYVTTMKQENVAAVKQQDELYETIAAKMKDYEKPAQDAVIHTVWKATPGYNGLSVDAEASYRKMKKNGVFDEKLLVFKQVSPRVHLNDLPPAPIYRGHPEKPMVAFLINVAWGNEYLPDMLRVLKKHGVKASFFLEGRWAEQNPDLVAQLSDGGHDIGNHSYSHPDMARLTSDETKRQITRTNEIIKGQTGKQPVWFAPPSGSFRQETIAAAAEYNMKTVLWTVDTIDWQKPAPNVLVERVMKKVHNGAMILMHPTESSSKSLETLITSIKQKGYSFGNVTMLMDEKRMPAPE
ncbi:polysaccharide deacetylase family protein [Metabacillus indicus]|uniref:polysaccharide deacetylase family protein n=1 Tax=Metabacillus indicus TaxID=246786 RepID=UPI002A08D4FB|nr:polysaccharide deacetylase family protein [Metabacillus indicus]MDX8288409.1 polysaccharide deacetylase family protein [Metabacillus indicus]